jgi:hypothetical protein
MSRLSIASTALAVSVLFVPFDAAQARIECDGNFQVVQGQPIATPYCQDQNLARVAQSYGMRTSFQELRRSDSVKGQICRAIGHDNRVYEVCRPFRNDGGPTFRN